MNSADCDGEPAREKGAGPTLDVSDERGDVSEAEEAALCGGVRQRLHR